MITGISSKNNLLKNIAVESISTGEFAIPVPPEPSPNNPADPDNENSAAKKIQMSKNKMKDFSARVLTQI